MSRPDNCVTMSIHQVAAVRAVSTRETSKTTGTYYTERLIIDLIDGDAALVLTLFSKSPLRKPAKPATLSTADRDLVDFYANQLASKLLYTHEASNEEWRDHYRADMQDLIGVIHRLEQAIDQTYIPF